MSNFNDVSEIFEQFGLDEKEIKVYLACLQSSDGLFVSEISEVTTIKRSTVDVVLKRLIKQGFINFFVTGRRNRYQAEKPEKLMFGFENTLRDFKNMIPFLTPGTSGNKQQKIRFYYGKESLFQMLNDVIITLKLSKLEHKEVLTVAAMEQMNHALGGRLTQLQNKRSQERVHVRIISPKDPLATSLDTEEADRTGLRKIRFLDSDKYPFTSAFHIYHNSIGIFNLGDNPGGVIIEDKELAESFRSLFNFTWDHLK